MFRLNKRVSFSSGLGPVVVKLTSFPVLLFPLNYTPIMGLADITGVRNKQTKKGS